MQTPCLSDAPLQDDRQTGADRGRLCHADRQLERAWALYLNCECLFVYICVSSRVYPSMSVCAMVQSGQCILKTLSGRIDFLSLDPWTRSCNTADPPSCVTLSFCDTDQSGDELEIATRRPWTLGGSGGRRRRCECQGRGSVQISSNSFQLKVSTRQGLYYNFDLFMMFLLHCDDASVRFHMIYYCVFFFKKFFRGQLWPWALKVKVRFKYLANLGSHILQGL